MATQIRFSGSLTFAVTSGPSGGLTASTSVQTYDFDSGGEHYSAAPQTLSTSYAALSVGDPGWTNISLLCLQNLSTTTGEDISVNLPPKMVAGLTDDGSVAGASVPATLTGAGYFRRISSAGTSQGKTWALDDIAIYLGSSGAYAQLRPKGFLLKPGETCAIGRIVGDGDPWRACAAAGTPQLAMVAIGALA